MTPVRKPDRRSIQLMLLGILLVIGSIWAFPQVPGTEYHISVDPVDDEEGKSAGEIGYMAYEFEELSSEAQTQFLAAKNASADRITFSEAERKAPEFQYGEHGSTVTYILHESEYYLVATSSSSCFAAVCDFLRWGIGFIALTGIVCVGFGIWRSI